MNNKGNVCVERYNNNKWNGFTITISEGCYENVHNRNAEWKLQFKTYDGMYVCLPFSIEMIWHVLNDKENIKR